MSMPPPARRAALGVPAFFSEERDTHLLGLMRVAFGVMLLVHVQRLFGELSALGYFGDRFFLPLLPPAWVPSAAVYRAMLASMGVLGIAVVLGIRARECLLLLASTSLYLLGCDRLQYHNNRFALLLLAFLLAFAPCDRSFALRPGGARGPAPIWAQRLFQLQVSVIYASSALSKLLDPDWFGGQVMWVRAARSLEYLSSQGIALPAFVAAAFASKLVLSVFSKLAIGGELFLAIGLWHPRSRVLALWWGVLFHLAIELGASVELFSYVMWTSYIAFVRPERRERRLLVTDGARGARVCGVALPALDWLSRWSIESVAREQRETICTIDRDGTRGTGLRAAVLLARTIPVLFPFWGPLALWERLVGQRRAST